LIGNRDNLSHSVPRRTKADLMFHVEHSTINLVLCQVVSTRPIHYKCLAGE